MLGYFKIRRWRKQKTSTTCQSGWPGPFKHMGRLHCISLPGVFTSFLPWQFHSFSERFCYCAHKKFAAAPLCFNLYPFTTLEALAGQVCLIPCPYYFEICCSVFNRTFNFYFLLSFAHSLIRTRWERRAKRPLWKSTLQNRRVPIRSFPNSPSTVCFLLHFALLFHSALFLSPTKWKIIQHLTVNFGDWFN